MLLNAAATLSAYSNGAGLTGLRKLIHQNIQSSFSLLASNTSPLALNADTFSRSQ